MNQVGGDLDSAGEPEGHVQAQIKTAARWSRVKTEVHFEGIAPHEGHRVGQRFVGRGVHGESPDDIGSLRESDQCRPVGPTVGTDRGKLLSAAVPS
jgi:hypothetical protein